MEDMAVAIVMEMVLEEIVFQQEEAVIEGIHKQAVTQVHVNLEAMLMLLYLLVIWHSKLINKK